MKAVIYARVSSRDQEKEGFSIPAQIKLLQEYAQKHGLEVSHIYQEAETAKKIGREQFNAMLEFLAGSPDHCILVEKTDRLYRNFKDYVRLEELNVPIHLVKEGETLTEDSRSHVKFIHGIKVLMAKNYIDNLSEEVKKGQREKAEQGHLPTIAPYGYKNNKETHMIEVDDSRAEFVKRAFELYNTQEYSLESLRKKLHDEGFRYRPSQARIALSSLHQMLTNPIYMGDFVWQGRYYKGKHEPLITVKTYETAKSIMQNRFKGKKTNRDFQFSGLMTCGICGRAITAELKKSKYVYYHCSNKDCANKSVNVREELLEEQFHGFLEGMQLPDDWREYIVQGLKESLSSEKTFHTEAMAGIERQLTTLRKKLETIYEDRLEGVITKEYWMQKHDEYTRDEQSLVKAMEQHKRGASSYYTTGIQLIELTEKAATLYKRQGATDRRRLLRFIVR